MNARCFLDNMVLQHSTFNTALKQVASIDNEMECCSHYPWVQCYQWRLLCPVFDISYFSGEFTIFNDFSFETLRICDYVAILIWFRANFIHQPLFLPHNIKSMYKFINPAKYRSYLGFLKVSLLFSVASKIIKESRTTRVLGRILCVDPFARGGYAPWPRKSAFLWKRLESRERKHKERQKWRLAP